MSRIFVACGALCFLMVVLVALWAYVLSNTVPHSWLVSSLPWPIACSSHGCITSKEWASQRSYDIAFAQKTAKVSPSNASTLTTLLRRHLITHATLQSPISPQDAVRYRTAILHDTDLATITPLGMSSFEQYDSTIVLPFLQQEALMQQTNISDTQTLYKNLAKQHPILLLLFHYHWNTDSGEVE